MNKKPIQNQTLEIGNAKNLVKIIKNSFLNIHDIIRRFDLDEAAKFLDKNSHFQKEHDKKHPHSHKHGGKGHSGCSHAHTGTIFIPKEHRSQKEQTLYELTQRWKIQLDMPEILEYLSARFNNIKQQGIKDWNSEAESFVLQEVLKTGVNQFYHTKLVRELAKKTKNFSTEHMLVANPTQFENMFPDFELVSIPREVISVMFNRKNTKHWTEQKEIENDNFEGLVFKIDKFVSKLDDFDILKKEMFYLETDGRFEKRIEQMIEKEEKHLWINFGQIEQESFPG